MAQQPFDNSILERFKTFPEIIKYALTHTNLNIDTDIMYTVNGFGQNAAINADTTEDLWAAGGTRPYPSSAETFNIVSSSANDTAAGTGVRTIRISGLDASFNLVSEDVTLNGTTNVETTTSFYNIHRMVGLTVGSGNKNAGAITATGTSSSDVMATIPVNDGITQMSHYMIPIGYTGFLVGENRSVYRTSGTGARRAEIELIFKPFGLPELVSHVSGHETGTDIIDRECPWPVPQLTLMWYRATPTQNNTAASVGYDLVVINNDYI